MVKNANLDQILVKAALHKSKAYNRNIKTIKQHKSFFLLIQHFAKIYKLRICNSKERWLTWLSLWFEEFI